MPRVPCPIQGLTLAELLLTLALFSILMVSVSALVLSGTAVQLGWGKSVEPYEQVERALNRLARDLTSTQPLFGIPVVVEADRLEMARVDQQLTVEGQPTSDWLRIVYRLTADGQGVTLVRQESLWRQGAEAKPLRQETLLHLKGGHFSFGLVDGKTQQLSWSTGWDGKTNGLPRLVKVDCTVAAPGSQPTLQLSRVVRNPAGTLPVVGTP